jgi:hypothetical protein
MLDDADVPFVDFLLGNAELTDEFELTVDAVLLDNAELREVVGDVDCSEPGSVRGVRSDTDVRDNIESIQLLYF